MSDICKKLQNWCILVAVVAGRVALVTSQVEGRSRKAGRQTPLTVTSRTPSAAEQPSADHCTVFVKSVKVGFVLSEQLDLSVWWGEDLCEGGGRGMVVQ